jgi:hypothetical protein
MKRIRICDVTGKELFTFDADDDDYDTRAIIVTEQEVECQVVEGRFGVELDGEAVRVLCLQSQERQSELLDGGLDADSVLILAEEAAMLDTLTNGRLDWGVGRGLKPLEFDAFCVPQARSREMFLEHMEVAKRIWADENFEHHGEFYHVNKQTPLTPPCVQKPHPPLYVSAQSEESLRWAAQNDTHFCQIDALYEECERDQVFYRNVQIASGLTGFDVARLRQLHLAREPMIYLEQVRPRRIDFVVKRCIDLLVSLAVLVLGLPLLVLAALAIKVTDPGPVFFKQVRVGKNGHLFTLYKFRTMVVDGVPQSDHAIPLVDDHHEHVIEIELA